MSLFTDTAATLTEKQDVLTRALGDADFVAAAGAALDLYGALDAHLNAVIPIRKLADKPHARTPFFTKAPDPMPPTERGDSFEESMQKSLDAQREAVKDYLSKGQYSLAANAARNIEALLYNYRSHLDTFVVPSIPSSTPS